MLAMCLAMREGGCYSSSAQRGASKVELYSSLQLRCLVNRSSVFSIGLALTLKKNGW